jgi:amino acid adenylation domain-containing protein
LFSQTAALRPDAPALFVRQQLYSYNLLSDYSHQIASTLPSSNAIGIGLLAHRSIAAFAGVLGILKSGHAYVPLNPNFPINRLVDTIEAAGIQTIVYGQECEALLPALQAQLPNTIAWVSAEHSFTHDEVTHTEGIQHTDIAYLLFTSGSSGKPKGVPVKHSSVHAYVKTIVDTYKPKHTDRFSQSFDLSFDLSVHDMFVCWSAGACLYCIPEKAVFAPAKFIREHELTWWFSVPSVIRFLDQFRMLKAGNFPSLTMSMFCGEALPLSLAVKWQQAANNSQVVNIYGPTEATIGISGYTLPEGENKIKHRNGVVSIGKVFEGQLHTILSDAPEKEAGELCLGGSQLTEGYWHNQEKTDECFFTDAQHRWYKTGDAVIEDNEGDIYYIGRLDFQAKINGYRVELEEINHTLNQRFGVSAYSVAWPVNEGIAASIYTFFSGHPSVSTAEMKMELQQKLPEYMQPKDLIFVASFPLNANGKINKEALLTLLQS